MIVPKHAETQLVGMQNTGCEDHSKDSIIEEYNIRFKYMHACHLVDNMIENVFYSLDSVDTRYGTFSCSRVLVSYKLVLSRNMLLAHG
jgi:hypothetical protein